MRMFGYKHNNSDHTFFLKKCHVKITVLIVYVDDMVVTGNDPREREFEMKYLGELKCYFRD